MPGLSGELAWPALLRASSIGPIRHIGIDGGIAVSLLTSFRTLLLIWGLRGIDHGHRGHRANVGTRSGAAAPQFPPTSTITTPGYPTPGPADPALRVVETAERQEGAPVAGDARDHTVGLVRQCAAAGAACQFRRHHRAGNDDAQSQPGGARRHHRADQEAAHRLPGPRTAHVDGADLHRGSAAGRRAQGHDQQDRAARLCDELQRAGHVRPVPERLSRTARSNISISISTR